MGRYEELIAQVEELMGRYEELIAQVEELLVEARSLLNQAKALDDDVVDTVDFRSDNADNWVVRWSPGGSTFIVLVDDGFRLEAEEVTAVTRYEGYHGNPPSIETALGEAAELLGRAARGELDDDR